MAHFLKYPTSDSLSDIDVRTLLHDQLFLLCQICHNDSHNAGWYMDPKTGEAYTHDVVPEKIALIHSEISEALEGHRKDKPDDHLPHRPSIEVELADAIIRIGDLAGRLKLDLAGAVIEKLRYNRSREDHKIENRAAAGGKKF